MKRATGLYAYRRHLRHCRFFGRGGREARFDKCHCPFHVDGDYNGDRVRRSLKTRSRQIAERRVADLVCDLESQSAKEHPEPFSLRPPPEAQSTDRTLSEAVERFLGTKGVLEPNGSFQGDIERATHRKYANSLRFLSSFCNQRGLSLVRRIDVDAVEDFRRTRKICSVTWTVERQTLITFFAYCVRRGWISANPAKELKAPRNHKPNEVVPYTHQEESLILAACDQIGGGTYHRSGARYEQRRARAMVMLLRHTALRISDVATLKRDSVQWDEENGTWRIFLHTQKTGEPVYLPVPESLKLALDALALPRNAARDCPYYFWNGHTSKRAVVGIAERTLFAVFKKSGVKNAHAHRYRHTLATRLLGDGASFQEVADILGNTADVVRKHYGKWSKGRQDKIDRLMIAHFKTAAATIPVTQKSHEKTEAVN